MSSATKPLVWLITGANKGIGLEISLIARRAGHTVIATARQASKFPTSLKNAGVHLLEIEIAASAPEIASKVDQLATQYGHIDILINNAGYAQLGAVEEVSDQEARYQFDVNFFGTLNFARAVLPHMRKQKSGVVVNISSMAGLVGGPGGPLYGASKFAVEGLSENMWFELQPLGIRTHVIEPGFVRTEFLSNQSKGGFVGKSIEGYGAGRDVAKMDGAQYGDPVKVAQRIVDVATATGMAKGMEWELRIPLGKDCHHFVGMKVESLQKTLEKTKEIAFSTDIGGGWFPKRNRLGVE